MDAKDIALMKKLGGGGGGSVTVDSGLSDTSTNPVQNKVLKAALDAKLAKSGIKGKTDAMTQAVGVDADGALWTEPGGGGSSGGYEDTVLFEITTTEEVSAVESDTFSNLGITEKLANADFIYIDVSIVPPSGESYTSNGKMVDFGVKQIGVYMKWKFVAQNAANIVPKAGANYNGEIKIQYMGKYQSSNGTQVRPMIGLNRTAQYTTTKYCGFETTYEQDILSEPQKYIFRASTDTAFGVGTTIRIVARRYL